MPARNFGRALRFPRISTVRALSAASLFLQLSLMLIFVTAASAAPSRQPAPTEDEINEVPQIELGEEYEGYKKLKPGKTPASETSFWRKALLYLPNRFLDLIDVVKVDVGVGPSFGGVLRVTKYGQLGYRSISPFSARLGLRGRKVPVFLESSSEFGIGPAFVQSHDRQVGASELGAGVDLIIVGAYAGVDLVSLTDFFLGIFGVDIADDDLK